MFLIGDRSKAGRPRKPYRTYVPSAKKTLTLPKFLFHRTLTLFSISILFIPVVSCQTVPPSGKQSHPLSPQAAAILAHKEDTLKLAKMLVNEEALQGYQAAMIQNLKNISSYEIPEEFWVRLKSSLTADLYIEELFLPIYMRHFSHDEIKEFIEIYSHPLMQKLHQLEPQFMKEVVIKSNMLGQKIGKSIWEEMEKEGYPLPRQRFFY